MNNSNVPVYSTTRLISLLFLAAAVALLTFAAAHMPYFPGDLTLAQAIQLLVPIPKRTAQAITATAEMPWCFVLLALSVITAWSISGWRAALLAFPVFFGLWLFGIWLSPFVAQPRPSPDLISVVGQPKGYAFPSIFGLIYFATFGYVALLAPVRSHRTGAISIPIIAGIVLVVGACVRIVLGAHWPSDLWIAYLMGVLWIELLLPFSRGDTLSNTTRYE